MFDRRGAAKSPQRAGGCKPSSPRLAHIQRPTALGCKDAEERIASFGLYEGLAKDAIEFLGDVCHLIVLGRKLRGAEVNVGLVHLGADLDVLGHEPGELDELVMTYTASRSVERVLGLGHALEHALALFR